MEEIVRFEVLFFACFEVFGSIEIVEDFYSIVFKCKLIVLKVVCMKMMFNFFVV